MSEAWVVNASPLILFARIDRLDLFERLSTSVIVPKAVQDEVRAGEQRDTSAATALAWAEIRGAPDIVVPSTIEHWDLGVGESQVIAHGLASSRWVVLDDRAARRCAEVHRLSVIGSLGVVLRQEARSARRSQAMGAQTDFGRHVHRPSAPGVLARERSGIAHRLV